MSVYLIKTYLLLSMFYFDDDTFCSYVYIFVKLVTTVKMYLEPAHIWSNNYVLFSCVSDVADVGVFVVFYRNAICKV